MLTANWCKNEYSPHTQFSSRHVEVCVFQASQFQALGSGASPFPVQFLNSPALHAVHSPFSPWYPS